MKPLVVKDNRIKVTHCARCGGTHSIYMHKFYKPVLFAGGRVLFNYWAVCPVRNDPILLYVE